MLTRLPHMGMNALMKALLRGWKVDDWFYIYQPSDNTRRVQVGLVYRTNGDEAKTITMMEL